MIAVRRERKCRRGINGANGPNLYESLSYTGMSPRWLTNFDEPRNVCGIDLPSCDSVSFMLVVRFSN
jgi:hypothetical protein